MSHIYSPPLSANLWNAHAAGVNEQSPTFDSGSNPFVSAFGHVSGATTITLMYSRDGVTFRAGPNVVLAGAGDFQFNATAGAEFLALQTTAAVTVSADISAKG